MARKIAAAVFSLGCLHSSTLMALGLGEMKLESFLNEPLKARVELLDTAGLHSDEVRIRLATQEDFERLGVDRAYFLTGIRFEVLIDGQGRGEIVLTSEDPVLEPYLDFIVEARWPAGRLLREYTVLVDPPVFQQSTQVVSASEAVARSDQNGSAGQKKSGTQVRLDTDGADPAGPSGRSFSEGAANQPAAGDRYLIRRDDTLWDIASRARPAGASVHQTMLDIQRLNPDAFIGGNINQIKAGYVIYLPDAGEISSDDIEGALDEVRQQNEDWQENRVSAAPAGPSLRISTSPDEEDGAAPEQGSSVSAARATAMEEDLARAERDRSEAQQRVSALEEQVATLEQIVSVKDDQIAALQRDLSAATGTSPTAPDDGGEAPADEGGAPVEATADTEQPDQAGATETAVASAPAAVQSSPQQPSTAAGIPNWIYLLLGGLAVGGGGLWFMRRRAGKDADDKAAEEVFADVELQHEKLEIDGSEAPPSFQELEQAMEAVPDPDPLPESLLEPALEEGPEDADTRGYGERKHDEYASDFEAGDALAEADIYIAYGRYPQAIELLNTAVASEPGNPTFRLKLLALYAETGERMRAQEQLAELRVIGHPSSIAEGEQILSGETGPSGAGDIPPIIQSGAPGSAANPAAELALDLDDFQSDSALDTAAGTLPDLAAVEGGETLEANFSGLEIEEEGGALSDDLDLSADFGGPSAEEAADEEMVFATEGSEMSTKLDLARAYMDMGDEDGARQILEEVATEGSSEQQEEAGLLLQRIG